MRLHFACPLARLSIIFSITRSRQLEDTMNFIFLWQKQYFTHLRVHKNIILPPCNILPSFTMKEIFIIAVFIQILEFLKKSAHVCKIKIKSGKMVGNLAFFSSCPVTTKDI